MQFYIPHTNRFEVDKSGQNSEISWIAGLPQDFAQDAAHLSTVDTPAEQVVRYRNSEDIVLKPLAHIVGRDR